MRIFLNRSITAHNCKTIYSFINNYNNLYNDNLRIFFLLTQNLVRQNSKKDKNH